VDRPVSDNSSDFTVGTARFVDCYTIDDDGKRRPITEAMARSALTRNRWAAFTDDELAEMQLSLVWRYDASDEVNARLLRQVKAEQARRPA
jgi:hypothetical protein